MLDSTATAYYSPHGQTDEDIFNPVTLMPTTVTQKQSDNP